MAGSIAGLSASTSCKNRIQVLRMPVSPSEGARGRPDRSRQSAKHGFRIRQRNAADEMHDRMPAAGGAHRELPSRIKEHVLQCSANQGFRPGITSRYRRGTVGEQRRTRDEGVERCQRLRAEAIRSISSSWRAPGTIRCDPARSRTAKSSIAGVETMASWPAAMIRIGWRILRGITRLRQLAHHPERGIRPGHRRPADRQLRLRLQHGDIAGVADRIRGEQVADERDAAASPRHRRRARRTSPALSAAAILTSERGGVDRRIPGSAIIGASSTMRSNQRCPA